MKVVIINTVSQKILAAFYHHVDALEFINSKVLYTCKHIEKEKGKDIQAMDMQTLEAHLGRYNSLTSACKYIRHENEKASKNNTHSAKIICDYLGWEIRVGIIGELVL
tara:strand:- start:18090 stop:18413 length:324 start_codon:yes stop_codon:yes gene_type:complete